MSGKLSWAIFSICLLLSVSALTWCYLQADFPKKAPVRAKQVLNLDINTHYYTKINYE